MTSVFRISLICVSVYVNFGQESDSLKKVTICNSLKKLLRKNTIFWNILIAFRLPYTAFGKNQYTQNWKKWYFFVDHLIINQLKDFKINIITSKVRNLKKLGNPEKIMKNNELLLKINFYFWFNKLLCCIIL